MTCCRSAHLSYYSFPVSLCIYYWWHVAVAAQPMSSFCPVQCSSPHSGTPSSVGPCRKRLTWSLPSSPGKVLWYVVC